MKKFEEYINEAIANKQITASLDSEKRELIFDFRGMFPPALMKALGKSLQSKSYTLTNDSLKIYL